MNETKERKAGRAYFAARIWIEVPLETCLIHQQMLFGIPCIPAECQSDTLPPSLSTLYFGCEEERKKKRRNTHSIDNEETQEG